MTARVQKWGNSLAVRIPSHIAKETGIHQGSWVPKKKKPTLHMKFDVCAEGHERL
ncbi:antitoxin MazE [Planifilum fulgidum]|jgi:antitoxin MazE|uniref:Antitoxin MazE n=1 Tax=Planifilum fulgidum TaxID=201973 RepID=A0A1I2P1C2_9BACL|nr:AbrB/MazE/SpoVT family DNA-binding domain-containing protein [Planifilum fulgidum]MBO2497923.1 AbrB/MazE/SpoVT family DNA-binding domain-containing protein [Bacillota bacterium]MBO2533304.1 AbrB/MazE/SpoVT family DNA-binding domain-containing protein [Thermoactinomycetaceae bacterium]SFG09952.1 antitoxin MazE [Planifilum fulgidum]